jgi:hypothetical protein
MLPEISKIKGIHPGVILKRELKLRGLKVKEYADFVNDHMYAMSPVLHEREGSISGYPSSWHDN